MRVLYFGTYDRAYPRNAQVISALRGAGVEVREQHRAVWERRHNWSVGLRQMLRVAEAEHSLRKSRDAERGADALIVGYPGHFDLPAARRAARRRPVIFNPLVSLVDTLVADRVDQWQECAVTDRKLKTLARLAAMRFAKWPVMRDNADAAIGFL